jgi:hypothetical protein
MMETVMKKAFALVLCLLCGCAKRPSTETSATASQQQAYQISLESEKLDAAQTPDGVGEAYRLTASGLPIGQKFTLFGKNFKEEEMVINYFFVDSSGNLMTYEEGKGVYGLSDILFKKGSFLRGEPYEYILVSEDGLTKARSFIVPNPISMASEDGAKISLMLATPDAKAWMVKGEAFRPGERLELMSRSGKESLKKIITVNPQGGFLAFLEPGVTGHNSGTASVSIKREKEKLSLEYPWGEEALRKQEK